MDNKLIWKKLRRRKRDDCNTCVSICGLQRQSNKADKGQM